MCPTPPPDNAACRQAYMIMYSRRGECSLFVSGNVKFCDNCGHRHSPQVNDLFSTTASAEYYASAADNHDVCLARSPAVHWLRTIDVVHCESNHRICSTALRIWSLLNVYCVWNTLCDVQRRNTICMKNIMTVSPWMLMRMWHVAVFTQCCQVMRVIER